MTLVQLRHLTSLAQTGSFRRSAEALFLTQPALSRSIQALEEELGQRLFDRIGWRSELTPFGREVLARAKRLITEAEHLKESAARLQTGQAGRLRVGLGSGPGAILTAPVLRHMATHHPAAQVEFARGHTALLEQALRERRLDALVVDIRSVPPLGRPAGAAAGRTARRLPLPRRPPLADPGRGRDRDRRRRCSSHLRQPAPLPDGLQPTERRNRPPAAGALRPPRPTWTTASPCAARTSAPWCRWWPAATPSCWRCVRPRRSCWSCRSTRR
jgi:DNA-binding transcriptional LysR family regulator